MSPSMRASRTTTGLLLLAAIAACAGAGPTAPLPPVPPPTTPTAAALSVTVLGLPVGTPARLSLAHGEDEPAAMTGPGVVDGLAAGAYTLHVAATCRHGLDACDDRDRFVPTWATLALDLAAGTRTDVEVAYDCVAFEPPDPAFAAIVHDAARATTGDADVALTCSVIATIIDLDAGALGVEDLGGIESLRSLETLGLSQAVQIADLGPLAALGRLRTLSIAAFGFGGGTLPIADLTPIAHLGRLERLFIADSLIATLPNLAALTSLRHLTLGRSLLTDLTPVAQLPWLEELALGSCPLPATAGPRAVLEDIAPLAALAELTSLSLACTSIVDLAPLAGLPKLERVNLHGNLITNVEPLRGAANLRVLDVGHNSLLTSVPVDAWPELRWLSVQDTSFGDVRPLYLHARRFETLEHLVLARTCVRVTRAPAAGYITAIRDTGASVSASDGPCLSRPRPAISTFELDDEGWMTSGDATPLRRIAAGGLDDGPFLEADDLRQGSTWYWDAPGHFLGDGSGWFDGILEFWLRQSATTSQFDDVDVILEGGGHTLTYRHLVPIGTEWTHVVVPLSQAGSNDRWWQGAEPAAEITVREALGAITRLRIRGEYRSGADTGGLASVHMGHPTASPLAAPPVATTGP